MDSHSFGSGEVGKEQHYQHGQRQMRVRQRPGQSLAPLLAPLTLIIWFV
jgi:hypothetical protein